MTAVIAPGLFGLAPPLANAPPGGGLKSLPDGGFTGVVAAALAATRAEAEPGGHPGSPILIGFAEVNPGQGEMADLGTAELALMLAGLAPLVQRHADAATLTEDTGSPDRIAEADIDLAEQPADTPGHDAIEALLMQLLGSLARPAPAATSGADSASDDGVEALSERLAALVGGGTPSSAGGTATGAAEWLAEVRDLLATQVALLRGQAGAGQRTDARELLAAQPLVSAAAATTDGERSNEVDDLALLPNAALDPGARGEQGIVRDIARLFASLTNSSNEQAQAALDDAGTLDLATPRPWLAAATSEEPEGAPAGAVELPDDVIAGQPLATPSTSLRAEAAQQAAARVTDPALLAARFADTVESAVIRGTSEVRLVLNPPDLGHLDISVVETEQGLRIRLEASQGATRELMERQLPALQQALEARDLRVDRLQVSQATPGTAGEATDGRTAGDPSTGGRGDGSGSQEPAWSPLAALGLTGGDRDDGADASSGTAATSTSRGAIGADGRVDVLA